MAKGPEAKAAVRAAYVHRKLPIAQCVKGLRPKVSPDTARRWKAEARAAGDDWDRARSASHLAGQGAEAVTQAVLEDFVALFQSTLTDLKDDAEVAAIDKAEAISRLSDAYHKTMSAVTRGNGKLSKLAVAMETVEKLAGFVQARFPRHANAFLEILEPFGEEISKVYGS
jgi:hypothetical protein